MVCVNIVESSVGCVPFWRLVTLCESEILWQVTFFNDAMCPFCHQPPALLNPGSDRDCGCVHTHTNGILYLLIMLLCGRKVQECSKQNGPGQVQELLWIFWSGSRPIARGCRRYITMRYSITSYFHTSITYHTSCVWSRVKKNYQDKSGQIQSTGTFVQSSLEPGLGPVLTLTSFHTSLVFISN